MLSERPGADFWVLIADESKSLIWRTNPMHRMSKKTSFAKFDWKQPPARRKKYLHRGQRKKYYKFKIKLITMILPLFLDFSVSHSVAQTFVLEKNRRKVMDCKSLSKLWKNWRKIVHIISRCWCAILGAREKSFRIAPCDNFKKITNYELLTERPGVDFCLLLSTQK